MGFTKLDEGIIQSSIMAEDSDTFKIWIVLLAVCKEDGIARVSPVFLANVCRLDIKVVEGIMEKLASPDPYSRTTTKEGRRIERINGGWFIINYHYYRSFTYSDSKEAVKKRRQRERGQGGDMSLFEGTLSGHSASASGDRDRSVREGEEDPAWWKSYEDYRELVKQGFNAAMDDSEWLEHQQKLNPGLHIQRSCRKAYENYWSREERWRKIVAGPIKKRPRKLNMKNALADSLGWSTYKSYLTREEQ